MQRCSPAIFENIEPMKSTPTNQRIDPKFPTAIYLVGFMGSGKSTIGQRLAQKMAWKFVDLDRRIEEEEGATIAEIFARAGEPVFRHKEHDMLRRILQETASGEGCIVALGGGTFAQKQNFDLLNNTGATSIWLECPVDILLYRCALMTNRPLFRDEASFRQLYEQRLPFYRQATIKVSTDNLSADEVVSIILALEAFQGFACRI